MNALTTPARNSRALNRSAAAAVEFFDPRSGRIRVLIDNDVSLPVSAVSGGSAR